MPLYLLKKEADLSKLPTPFSEDINCEEYVIGDLHGNTMAFIHILVQIGAIPNLSTAQYQQLYDSYNHPSWTSNDADIDTIKNNLLQFSSIIETIELKCDKRIVLLGDEICDRGACDILTFYLLDKLHSSAVNYQIIVSNHGHAFLKAYFTRLATGKFPDGEEYFSDYEMYASYTSLRRLINLEVIQFNALEEWIKRLYLPHLKLFTCIKTENMLGICTHANLEGGLTKISEIFTNVGYTPSHNLSADSLMTDFEIANEYFKAHIQNHLNSPWLMDFCWTRTHSGKEGKLGSVNVVYIHGHDRVPGPYGITLDSEFGKRKCQGEVLRFVAFHPNPLINIPNWIEEIDVNYFSSTSTNVRREEPVNLPLLRCKRNQTLFEYLLNCFFDEAEKYNMYIEALINAEGDLKVFILGLSLEQQAELKKLFELSEACKNSEEYKLLLQPGLEITTTSVSSSGFFANQKTLSPGEKIAMWYNSQGYNTLKLSYSDLLQGIIQGKKNPLYGIQNQIDSWYQLEYMKYAASLLNALLIVKQKRTKNMEIFRNLLITLAKTYNGCDPFFPPNTMELSFNPFLNISSLVELIAAQNDVLGLLSLEQQIRETYFSPVVECFLEKLADEIQNKINSNIAAQRTKKAELVEYDDVSMADMSDFESFASDEEITDDEYLDDIDDPCEVSGAPSA